jgi:hypothetical protein
MDRNDLLAELARDAALERSDFLVRAGEQLQRFVDANKGRIRDIGGLTLIDEDPDFLAVAPDGSFRSRTRFFDDVTGDWNSETEIIDSAAELVELYNPADIYAAFAEAGEAEEDEDGEEAEGDDIANPYAAAADQWAAGPDAADEAPGAVPSSEADAARRLYDLALDFQERSQASEARLIEQFERVAVTLTPITGEIIVTEDDDERLVLEAGAGFAASVLTEEDGQWRALRDPASLVEYYDPTDVFSDLAEAVAETFPSVAPGFATWEDDGADGGADAGPDDGSDSKA